MIGNIDRIAALNRLLDLERLSLANYLQYAQPWIGPKDHMLRETVERIAREELECGRRIADFIIRRKAGVNLSQGFPARYTAYNDVALRRLLDRLIADEERIIREVRAILSDLRGDAEAEALVAEVLGSEQAHLKMLRQFWDLPEVSHTLLAHAA
jgi:hypothetical protein